MTPSMIWRLPAAQRRSRPCPLGVVLGSRHHQRALLVGPVPLPSNASEPFVGQIELVSILADKPIRYGALLGNDLGHPEGGDDALQAHREPYLEPVNPLGLRSAPAEGSLPAEEPFARSSHPHDGRDEGSIQHVVGGRGLGQSSVSTAESASKAGRPGLGVSQEREAFHQSSTRTYNEIKKESRSSMGPSFGESLVHQHTVLAPSPLLRITHQPSKDMREASVKRAFKLFKKGSTTQIAAQVSYDAATDTATLNPHNNLRRGVTYKAVVSTVAKDLAGNRLDQDDSTAGLQQKVWFFEID